MLRLIFKQLWFAFIPLVAYLIWVNLGENKEHPHRQKVKRYSIGACFIIAIVTLLILGIASKPLDGEYKPARYENGVLIDGEIK